MNDEGGRKVETNEIMAMCKSVAAKYRRQDQYEDMVSEGILVALELQEKDPYVEFNTIYTGVNKRLHDYLNIDLLPVHVPASDVARRLSRNPDTPLEEMGDNTWRDNSIEYLRNVFKGGYTPLDGLEKPFDEYKESYEDKEFSEKLRKSLSDNLSKDEKFHITLRFEEGLSLQEIGDRLGVSKAAVGKRESKLFSKLRGLVANLQ